ncbi:ArsR family transcriptional regulator [Acidianus sulfidivorans JP7]|uniref:TrmB family transcriptional regulator n=1 Tax=Acidianus sulfidivorans JP7 TaxID=619593 RepID=A0A2U9IJX1_9CREN|nr:helix-turn-helix domain-containing protein [Acidianus sulfidivorans]AWR96328.1 ArsR family transcriptional regulator [Acidianus sulfidivorans JP7]
MEETIERTNIENEEDKWHNIKCCYRLNETEIACFVKILELNKPVTSMELAHAMKYSKTTVETSLRKLIELGLIIREKIEGSRIGRPKYVYRLPDSIWSKIERDLNKCSESMRNTKL